jgi:predicted nucleic acid-binding protein
MRAIDTNVLVRLITKDDPEQAAAAERFIAPGAWVSNLALAEATWVLTSIYDLGSNDIGAFIEMLIEHTSLVLQEPEAVAAALQLFREKPTLEFSDCLMVTLAARAGHGPLGTFDRRLSKVDGVQRL